MGLLRRLSRWVISLAQRAVIAVLRAGPMPAHIAFVMDGNRRYATSHGLDATAGHGYGYTALERVLEICARLEIRCVSVYAFSIDNFKRAPGEVTTLMGLAEDKLRELARHGALFDKYNIRLNVCGRKEMLPPAVQEAVRWAEERTKHHDRAILNLCMPYTSRDEMTTAVEKAVQATLDQGLDPKYVIQ
jgi:ditrans,polycis-polyprenyl diphosphate synthase